MTDTTTISIRDDQKDELEAMKTHERESYKAVLDRLLDADAQDNSDTEPMRVVPIEEVAGREVPAQSVDLSEVNAKLDRIDSALGDNRNAVEIEATSIKEIGNEIEGRLR